MAKVGHKNNIFQYVRKIFALLVRKKSKWNFNSFSVESGDVWMVREKFFLWIVRQSSLIKYVAKSFRRMPLAICHILCENFFFQKFAKKS